MTDKMFAKGVFQTNEDRELLLRVSSLLEEVVKTFDRLKNEEEIKDIREAEEDLKAGRVRGYDEFIGEQKKSGEI